MSWSIGEVMALAVKAARGADVPWGLAEEAGFSVGWLQARGFDGIHALASLLEARSAQRIVISNPVENPYFSAGAINHDSHTDRRIFCPIAVGASLLDFDFEKPVQHASLGTVQVPLLLVPFLVTGLSQRQLQDHIGIAMDGEIFAATAIDRGDNSTITAMNAQITKGSVATALVSVEQASGTRLPQYSVMTSSPLPANRVNASFREDLERLKVFANNTYAPATDYSRLSGAGPATTDND